MNEIIRGHIDNICSKDKALQNAAFDYLLGNTEQPVDWAYDVWDEIVSLLTHKDNRARAISSQLLCNLAKSDPENRILDDFDALLNVTRDERFVTARHCLQAIWKVGLAGEAQQKMLINGLVTRFEECVNEKNTTLIRFDIVQGLRNLYETVGDASIQETALSLIEQESAAKYRKKYAKVWK